MTETRPKLHNLNTFFFSLAILNSVMWSILSFGELIGLTNIGWHDNIQELFIFGLFNAVFFIFAVALLFLKKWGVYGIIASGFLYAISYILFFESSNSTFFQIPIGEMFFATLFIWRHYKLMR